ncbi:MAG: hypothetical protein Q8942_18390 [Bacillota bacterium]|nr:hypothetical protein [Bacillota bacterium]
MNLQQPGRSEAIQLYSTLGATLESFPSHDSSIHKFFQLCRRSSPTG